MFIEALFTVTKTWKQPRGYQQMIGLRRCLYIYIYIYIYIYTHTYIHIHTHIYKMKYYSAIKKWNIFICNNMDGPIDYHTKWSKSDRERQILYDIYIYVKSKK